MEDAEVPTEGLQEELHHQATHSHPRDRWIAWVALSSALFAALAAVGALLSGHHANESMLEQLHASDHWAEYQSKSIKAAILRSRLSLLGAFGKETPKADEDKAKQYEFQQAEISKEAKNEEQESAVHLAIHQIYARSVTFSQIAIALGAIAALSRKKRFWFIALGSGGMGVVFLVQGFLH